LDRAAWALQWFLMVDVFSSSLSVARFIRTRRSDILSDWTRQVRAKTPAKGFSQVTLVDEVPELLEEIATLAEGLSVGEAIHGTHHTIHHALARLSLGFTLEELVVEFQLLRECILTLWEEQQGGRPPDESTIHLHGAIDRVVSESVTQYVDLRNRVTTALDHVSTNAMASSSLDEFLSRLLHVFMNEMPTVQTCVILLREGERLRARAAIGLEEELYGEGFSIAIGEGFAGTIARTQTPLMLHSASTDPLVQNPVIHGKRVKALYGVPLIHEMRGLIGVAHMGSLTANEFSIEDMQLFRSLAARAALAIEYHLAKEAVAQAVWLRDDILAVVAHDLRNPIAAVLLEAQILRQVLRREGNERALKSSRTIERSAERMNRLVGDLLDYGSIETGQLRLSIKGESVADILDDVMDANAAVASEQNVQLRRSTPESLPFIECDRERVLQALDNLIANALKASSAGTTITIGAEVLEDGVRFSVSDEGVGIEPAELDHIFERYRRAADERMPGRGRGLGLAIVKGIVEAHGGKVGVTSTVGKGITFYFQLPRTLSQPLKWSPAELTTGT
jgi:signal transduction histidine kinase